MIIGIDWVIILNLIAFIAGMVMGVSLMRSDYYIGPRY